MVVLSAVVQTVMFVDTVGDVVMLYILSLLCFDCG